MGNNLGWQMTQFSNVLFTTSRALIMRKHISEDTILRSKFDVSMHVAHDLVGGVATGQWTIGHPIGNPAMGQGVLGSGIPVTAPERLDDKT
eukprot:14799906-Ditylum_brightwellii.AAC.1